MLPKPISPSFTTTAFAPGNFSVKNLYCSKCNISYEELEPRFFSFNSPQGACKKCAGLGSQMKVDIDLLVPDKKKSLLTGCVIPLGEQPQSNWIGQIIKSLLLEYKSHID